MNKLYLIFLCIMFISGCEEYRQACVDEKCFRIEVVDSVEERSIGLMKYDSLQEDEGMFFIFDQDARHSIWMKDMKFAIDIIWLDSNYRVVDIKTDARPCKTECEIYSPSSNARYVLEVNANSNINIGDALEIR